MVQILKYKLERYQQKYESAKPSVHHSEKYIITIIVNIIIIIIYSFLMLLTLRVSVLSL